MRSRVRGKPGWAITRPATRSTLAAPGSSGSTSTSSSPANGDMSSHARLTSRRSSSSAVTALLRCRQPVTATGTHAVAERLGHGREPRDAGLVRARRAPDEEGAADAQDVAALERRGQRGVARSAGSGRAPPRRPRPRRRREAAPGCVRSATSSSTTATSSTKQQSGKRGIGRQLDDLEPERAQQRRRTRRAGRPRGRGRSARARGRSARSGRAWAGRPASRRCRPSRSLAPAADSAC